jgi:hypothetical protein
MKPAGVDLPLLAAILIGLITINSIDRNAICPLGVKIRICPPTANWTLWLEFGALKIAVATLIGRLLSQEDDWIVAIFAAELMSFRKIKLAKPLIEAKVDDEDERRYI